MAGALLVVGVLVAGCAASVDTVERVVIAPDLTLELPAPAALGRTVDASQVVTAHYGRESYGFEARLAIGPDQVRLVGTDPMGRRALVITWNGRTLTVQRAAFLPETVRPENVLADIILIFWPEAALRRGLAAAGGTVTVRGATRAIGRAGDGAGEEAITIRYEGPPWSGLTHLTNHAWHYAIDVRSAAVGP
jgi:hypothetical protein